MLGAESVSRYQSSLPFVRAEALQAGNVASRFCPTVVLPTVTERKIVVPFALSDSALAHVLLAADVGGACSETFSDTRPGAPFADSTKRKYVPGGNAGTARLALPLVGASHESSVPVQPPRR